MTSNHGSWPNPEHAGEPAQPTKTGPHALIDKYGMEVWGWWIYYPSAPGEWLVASTPSFQGGASELTHAGFKYLGPAIMPEQATS